LHYVDPGAIPFNNQTEICPQSGSLQVPSSCLLMNSSRGLFLKTVFSAFERFDSAQSEFGVLAVSTVCKKMSATCEEGGVPRKA
jgi:hypothetical protein